MKESSRKLVCLALTIAFGVLAVPLSHAEKGYYKWVDSKGNPHHSDRPPPNGVSYDFISTDTGLKRRVDPSKEDEASPKGWASAMPPGDEDGEQPNMAEQQASIQKDPAVCDQARANLDSLNSKARVRIRDDDGIRYLTEEEKETQRKKAQDLIAVHCGS